MSSSSPNDRVALTPALARAEEGLARREALAQIAVIEAQGRTLIAEPQARPMFWRTLICAGIGAWLIIYVAVRWQ